MFEIDDIINHEMLILKITHFPNQKAPEAYRPPSRLNKGSFTQKFRGTFDPDSGAWRPDAKIQFWETDDKTSTPKLKMKNRGSELKYKSLTKANACFCPKREVTCPNPPI